MHTSVCYNVELLNQSAVLMLYAHIISPKCGRVLSTHSIDFIHRYMNASRQVRGKIASGEVTVV